MHHTCPWWLNFTFDNPLRRLLHEPSALLEPFVQPGMRVADLGCGMGHFTLGLAKLVGPNGQVQAIDLQAESLGRVRRRLERAGMASRVTLVLAEAHDPRLEGTVDFVLAFWMVHEVADTSGLFAKVREHLARDGRMLVAEPLLHVGAARFARSLAAARAAGLRECQGPPPIRWSRSALLAADAG